jgi:hypothetical protein
MCVTKHDVIVLGCGHLGSVNNLTSSHQFVTETRQETGPTTARLRMNRLKVEQDEWPETEYKNRHSCRMAQKKIQKM